MKADALAKEAITAPNSYLENKITYEDALALIDINITNEWNDTYNSLTTTKGRYKMQFNSSLPPRPSSGSKIPPEGQ